MLRQWRAANEAHLQRLGEDRKHEKRWPIRVRRQYQDAYARRAEKHRRRVKTWIDQMAAQVAGFARRRGVCQVYYDDADRRFADSFPWHQAAEALARALGGGGITFTPVREGGGGERNPGDRSRDGGD
jgi:hypothetical protein